MYGFDFRLVWSLMMQFPMLLRCGLIFQLSGNLYLVKVTSQTRQIILDVVASKNGFR